MTRGRATPRGLVLLAESNDGMREAINHLLDAAGFPSVVYATAEELLGGGRAGDARCVISDINLSGMSGFQLPAKLRALEAAPPVILICAHDSAAIRRKAEKCGAAGYLARPFAGSELIAEIERLASAVSRTRVRNVIR